jgi:hypothetical protein
MSNSKGKKVKVKFSLCSTEHQTMKTYRGVEVQLHAFLISALDGGKAQISKNTFGKYV